ncbi:MAG TPA: NmrA/HSCARG family protein [Armatimonadota bacterium]|jgi:uncharacterized protein YbjT (DUF2867 family)
MSDKPGIILVTGATGKQGGATARHLLASGWPLRALTRDPAKPAAQALAAQGVELMEGYMEDPDALARAMAGVYGVFSVQNTWTAGVEGELEEGRAVVDAAQAAGVQHVVYTSVGGAERSTGIPHFDSKYELEEYLCASGLAWTILRPVFFMDNLLSPENRKMIDAGTFLFGLPEDTPLQMVAVDDIGAFAAMAFDRAAEFVGKAHELAGDELTMPAAVAKLGAALGQEVKYAQLPLDTIRAQNEDWAIMLEWFIRHGYEANIEVLRDLYPGLKDFDAWVASVNWCDWTAG